MQTSAIAGFRVLNHVTMHLPISTCETTHRACITGGIYFGAGTPHKGTEQWHLQILPSQLSHPGEKRVPLSSSFQTKSLMGISLD